MLEMSRGAFEFDHLHLEGLHGTDSRVMGFDRGEDTV